MFKHLFFRNEKLYFFFIILNLQGDPRNFTFYTGWFQKEISTTSQRI